MNLHPYALERTHFRNMYSADIGGDFEIIVHLPMSYAHSDKDYPCLLVTDANVMMGSVVDAMFMQSATQEIEELVIVGISHPRSEGMLGWMNRRLYDFLPVPFTDDSHPDDPTVANLKAQLKATGQPLEDITGGAPKFLSFIEDQVLPWACANFRIDAQQLGLYGHSGGGLFCSYVMLSGGSRFNKFIVGTFPGMFYKEDQQDLFGSWQRQHTDKAWQVFHGVGGEELSNQAIGSIARSGLDMIRKMDEISDTEQTYSVRIFDDETHTSMIPHLIGTGLRVMYGTGTRYGDSRSSN